MTKIDLANENIRAHRKSCKNSPSKLYSQNDDEEGDYVAVKKDTIDLPKISKNSPYYSPIKVLKSSPEKADQKKSKTKNLQVI